MPMMAWMIPSNPRVATTGAISTIIRDKHNQYHEVTITELSGIIGELVDYGLSLYQRKWELEADIAAADTVESVESVVW